jgi:DHA1 family tetracycline resistance protein-like MFS transporter
VTPPRKIGKAALAFIFATVALDMIGLGLIGPVFPKLVVGFVGGDVARASEIYGLFGTIFALMQFAASPVLGALSDRFGRKPIIVLSSLGLGLDYVLMALAPNLAWLFVGRVISGVTSASAATAFAYIADVAPPEERAKGFGLLGAAFGLGFILGPALGGLLGGFNERLPFWFAAGLGLVNALYGWFVLPESLPLEKRRAFVWSRANPLGALRLLRSHRELSDLSIVGFCSALAGVAMPAVWVLYVDYRYHWGAGAVGLSLAWVGITSALVQALAVGPIVKRFGERTALFAGLVCGALGVTIFGFASQGWMFALGTPIMMFWSLVPAAAQAIMTRRVGPSEQGELQGALGSIRGIAALIGPSIFNLTFAAAVGPLVVWNLPGAPWLLSAIILIAALPLAARATRRANAAGAASAQLADARDEAIAAASGAAVVAETTAVGTTAET